MDKIKTISGQCIEDIAMKHYGGVEGVEKLLLDNREVLPAGFNTVLVPGTELAIDPDYSVNAEMKAAIAQLQLTFATEVAGAKPPVLGSEFNGDFNNDFTTEDE